MAWVATVEEISIDGAVAVAVVKFVDAEAGKTFVEKKSGDNLTLALLQDWAAQRIESLQTRDQSIEAIKNLVGQVLTPEKQPPVQPTALTEFYSAWRNLTMYRRLSSAKFSAEEATALKAVEDYLIANPGNVPFVSPF